MNAWANTLILISFFVMVSEALLHESKKDVLANPLKLVATLCLLLCLVYPIFSVFVKLDSMELPTHLKCENELSMQDILLTKTGDEIAKAIRLAFPDAKFRLHLKTNDEATISSILVEGDDAERISDFIRAKYQISAEVIRKEEST